MVPGTLLISVYLHHTCAGDRSDSKSGWYGSVPYQIAYNSTVAQGNSTVAQGYIALDVTVAWYHTTL
jgi:hypothetical protein